MTETAPVVLVHGIGSTTAHGWGPAGWLEILREAGREVIPVDLPGHGTSRRDTDPAAYADAAKEVAEAFADRGPVAGVGFSAGGGLLLECAARGLAAFDRLALLGVGPRVLKPPAQADTAFPATGEEIDPANVAARLFRNLARSAGNDFAAISAFARRPRNPLTPVELAAVACDVLIVAGERDRTAGRPEELAAQLPTASVEVIAGADHFSLQSNVRAMDAVLRFLGV